MVSPKEKEDKMTTTKKTIEDCTTLELLKLLATDCEIFYLPYCDDEEAKIQHFVFRSMILTILRKRFEEEMLAII